MEEAHHHIEQGLKTVVESIPSVKVTKKFGIVGLEDSFS